jgi:hypothetical protein
LCKASLLLIIAQDIDSLHDVSTGQEYIFLKGGSERCEQTARSEALDDSSSQETAV